MSTRLAEAASVNDVNGPLISSANKHKQVLAVTNKNVDAHLCLVVLVDVVEQFVVFVDDLIIVICGCCEFFFSERNEAKSV